MKYRQQLRGCSVSSLLQRTLTLPDLEEGDLVDVLGSVCEPQSVECVRIRTSSLGRHLPASSVLPL